MRAADSSCSHTASSTPIDVVAAWHRHPVRRGCWLML